MSAKDSQISQKESELIEKVAKKIVNSDFEFFALILLQTVKPIVWIGGELAYFVLAPYLPLLNEKGYDFLDTFEKRENIERLIKRVERLSKEKEKTTPPSVWTRLKQRFFS